MQYIELSGDGKVRMPIVGLGTWRAQPQETENAVENALKFGYRHIGKHSWQENHVLLYICIFRHSF